MDASKNQSSPGQSANPFLCYSPEYKIQDGGHLRFWVALVFERNLLDLNPQKKQVAYLSFLKPNSSINQLVIFNTSIEFSDKEVTTMRGMRGSVQVFLIHNPAFTPQCGPLAR
jgi:hypothetical protein